MKITVITVTALLVASPAFAQSAQARYIPQSDSSYIDPDGTAHITRVVPVPDTISPEAKKVLAKQISDAPVHQTVAERRSHLDKWQKEAGEESRKVYPVQGIEQQTIAGVPVRVITPLEFPGDKRDHILLNVHGGGFDADSGSLTESIPIANLTRTKVIAILYRLAPEHPFPAAVEDTVSVYREMLKSYKPERMALYGTSAGAILTAQVAVKLKQLGLPLPGALGVFSGMGDFSKRDDSAAMYGLDGLSGPLTPPSKEPFLTPYVGNKDRTDPVLSPIYADLKGLPPTLFVTSTRDSLLSGTARLHRAFLRGGVDGRLVVFEALPHAFWNNVSLPESREFNERVAEFFNKVLAR